MGNEVMPAAFIGHGSPMITFADNPITSTWRQFATRIPVPKAIVVISAHWYIHASAVTAMARPRTIHDFFGFPEELFSFEYPAPGAPELAGEMVEVIKPTWLGLDVDSWGLDHGAWSVLAHLYPDAHIPTVQLSLNASLPFSYHYELGAQLAPLRSKGVLFLASGNVIHNGQLMREEAGSKSLRERARRFDARVSEMLTERPEAVVSLEQHDDYRLAAPTAEHFLPLLYIAGLAAAEGSTAQVLFDGPRNDALGMSAFVLE
jgi:4,5-DOPA dioxygenase extradiol